MVSQGTSKVIGRGSGFFSHSSLAMLISLAPRMPNLATTGTNRGNPFEARLLNMRPLTDHWSDEACLTQMSANPLSPSPTMPCLFSEQPGAKAAAEQLTHPAAIEDIIQIMLFMVPYFLLFGQGNFNTQTTFTCFLFMMQFQPVLA